MSTHNNNSKDGNTCANFIWPLNLPSEKKRAHYIFGSPEVFQRGFWEVIHIMPLTETCSSPVFLYTREQLGYASNPMIMISLRELMSDMCGCGGLRNQGLQSS